MLLNVWQFGSPGVYVDTLHPGVGFFFYSLYMSLNHILIGLGVFFMVDSQRELYNISTIENIVRIIIFL